MRNSIPGIFHFNTSFCCWYVINKYILFHFISCLNSVQYGQRMHLSVLSIFLLSSWNWPFLSSRITSSLVHGGHCGSDLALTPEIIRKQRYISCLTSESDRVSTILPNHWLLQCCNCELMLIVLRALVLLWFINFKQNAVFRLFKKVLTITSQNTS